MVTCAVLGDGTQRIAVLGGMDASDVLAVLAQLSSRERLAIVVHCDDPTTSSQLHAALPDVVDTQLPTKFELGVIYVLGESPTLDSVLCSTADSYGAQSIGVILAGAASRGVLGIRRIQEVGGITIAQAGAATPSVIDLVLDAREIASRLQAIAGHQPSQDTGGDGDTLGDIIEFVRACTGHDFASHKRATLSRRVSRRMQISQTATISDYSHLLRTHAGEVTLLLRDFLNGVTSFFRDTDAFAALERAVIPALFAGKAPSDQVRVWVPGCATGEEVYSIAMLLDEHAREHGAPQPIQLFATDTDEESLVEARVARYPESIAVDVRPDRLARYFVRHHGAYRVAPALRELVLFSRHDLLRDPPFSRLDLVSCRNVLVHFNREAQDTILRGFHFALSDDRYLFLGTAESAGHRSLFAEHDATHRIFARRTSTVRLVPPFNTRRGRHEDTIEELRAENEQLQTVANALHAEVRALQLDKQALESANAELVTLNRGLARKIEALEARSDDDT